MRAIVAAAALAVPFEALALLATQDRTVRAASPWQDDPYNVAVSIAELTVPVLLVVIAVRLAAWRAPGAGDRERPTRRAARMLLALIGLALAAQWTAVAARAHAAAWSGWTTLLIAGLAILTFAALLTTAFLWRSPPRPDLAPGAVAGARRGRGPGGDQGGGAGLPHDWLADAALVVRHRRAAAVAAWIRTHATAVFATVSLLAGAGLTGAQSIGDRWTDPLLIGWGFVAWTLTAYALCIVGNAVAGFIDRPGRSRPARRAETALVSGAAGLLLAVAFRDPVWTLVTGGPISSVPLFATLTLGSGLGAAALAAATLPSVTRATR